MKKGLLILAAGLFFGTMSYTVYASSNNVNVEISKEEDDKKKKKKCKDGDKKACCSADKTENKKEASVDKNVNTAPAEATAKSCSKDAGAKKACCASKKEVK